MLPLPYVRAIRPDSPFPVSTITELLVPRNRLIQELTCLVAAGLNEFDVQFVGAPVGLVQQIGRLPTHRGTGRLDLSRLWTCVRVTLWVMIRALARSMCAPIGNWARLPSILATGWPRLTVIMLLLRRLLATLGRNWVGLRLRPLKKMFLGATPVSVRWLVE